MGSNTRIKNITVFAFALFFGWILSLPYEGPVMYGMANVAKLNGKFLNILTVLLHFIGLFSARYITKTVKSAKKFILILLFICLVGSLLIPITPTEYWVLLLPIISLFAGMFVTTYAHLIKNNVENKDRLKAVADMLIYSNIVLIFAHILTNNTKPIVGFIFIESILVLTIFFVYRLPIIEKKDMLTSNDLDNTSILSVYLVFSLFIFVITINSGIMFQVIYPYFYEYETLVSIYTNIPYIIAIYGLSRLYKDVNKSYMLYVGLAFWGVTFIIFALMNKSPFSFVIICTFMLAACGIFDIFWWSIMGNLFEYHENPASVFGLGLSMNVSGVWVGGLIGNYMINSGATREVLSFLGFGVILASMLIIIPLNMKLSLLIKEHEFLFRFSQMNDEDKNTEIKRSESLLTNREFEIFKYLLKGTTNKDICKKLFISMNTLKTHNRNIYKKLDVKSKVELISTWKN